ncbi:MAG: hypothetical protein ACI959_000546 [Limisphaerales bacterium]|jgi:hypothetical protein
MKSIYNVVAIAMIMIGSTFAVSAQMVNCGALVGDAGSLTPPASTELEIGFATAPAVLSGYSGGLPNIEYAIINPDILVSDSTTTGALFLDANTTGVFDPTAYGLGAGDNFCIVAASYDLAIIKNAVDEILNGSFLFTPCCGLISTFVPDIGDICGSLNAAGIFGPGDVNGLNDVFALTIVLGGAESFEALANTIDLEINPLITGGTPCVGNDEICYTISSPLCYTLTSGGAPCTTAPTGLSSVNGGSSVALSWNAVSTSVACQVKGTRTVPPGPSPSVNILGVEPTGTNVPYAVAGAGTTWTWKTRCACSITPLIATPFSVDGTFTIPSPREAQDFTMNMYPNPATDYVRVSWDNAVEVNSVEVIDLMGRVITTATPNGQVAVLDVSDVAEGAYLVRVGDQITEQITILK